MKLVQKITLLIVSSVVPIMGTAGYLSIDRTQKMMGEQIDRLLSSNLNRAKSAVIDTSRDIKRTAHTISIHPEIGKALHLEVSRGINRVLNEIVLTYPFYNYVLIVDMDGTIFASSTRDHQRNKISGEQLLGLNYLENPLYTEPSANETIAGNPGIDPYLALMELDRGISQWYISPVKKGGKIIGKVVVSYDWENQISELLTKINQRLTELNDPVVDTILTDVNRNILVSANSSSEKFVPTSDLLWRETQIVFGNSPMTLTIVNDKNKTNQPITELWRLFFIVTVCSAICLIFLFTIILNKTFLGRLKMIVDGAKRIGTGDLSHRLPECGADEVGELAKTFNMMTESLEGYQNDLEKLVDERTQELKGANEQLRSEVSERKRTEIELTRSNKELEEFAYVVSHDLKAPLRGISSLSEWIADDYSDKLDDDGKRQLRLLKQRVGRMDNLISGILEYSRVGRSDNESKITDLNEIVSYAIDLIAAPPNISINLNAKLPHVLCHKVRVEQVFENLLSNAVRYIDKQNGEIRVGCTENDDFWKFQVADNGPGIDEKYFQKIFKLFETLQPKDNSESTGVGLALVKKIIDQHGGDVGVESKVGEGSIFWFTLPKA